MEKKEKTPKTKEEKKALDQEDRDLVALHRRRLARLILEADLFGSTLYGEDANGFIAIGDWFKLNALNFLKTALLVLDHLDDSFRS
jgi:hypothetical protein